MVQLYIDNKIIELTTDFNISITEENPVFTKNSTYTYDINISLLNANNAEIYKHLNRLNIVNKLTQNRKAVLVVDARVILRGTEIILEHTHKDVKIQLVSGNSELNFLAGSKQKLRDLDLGKAQPFTSKLPYPQNYNDIAKQVFESLKFDYPMRNWHLLPFYTNEPIDGDLITGNQVYTIYGNYYQLNDNFKPDGNIGIQSYDAYYTSAYSGQVPQPYLCFIIEIVLKSLGYKITYNALAGDALLKNIYIVHGIQTLEFAKMLPEWNVDEFLSKIELQFDCVFVVDERTKYVELLFYKNSQNTQKKITLEAVDEFKFETDQDNRLNISVSNVGYDLDSEDYYNFACVDERYIEKVRNDGNIILFSTFEDLKNEVANINDAMRFKKIWFNGYDYFIAYDTGFIENGRSKVVPKKIDFFRNLYNNKKSEEINHKFEIIPSSYICLATNTTMVKDIAYYQIAKAGVFDALATPKEDVETDYNIQDLIEGQQSFDTDFSYTKMRVAIYDGLKKLDTKVQSRYPITYVESLCEYFTETGIERYFLGRFDNPFRLDYLNEKIYKKNFIIDTTKTYKFTFELIENIDIRADFIIKNKKFVCYKIERFITIMGFKPLAIGYFYPYE